MRWNVFFLVISAFSILLFQNCNRIELAPSTVDQISYFNLKIKNCREEGVEGGEIVSVFASNLALRIYENQLEVDSDKDGLVDLLEIDPAVSDRFGLNRTQEDTVSDDYRDAIVFRAGIDLENQYNLAFCDTGLDDTDRDGLRDCEEELLNLNPLLPDSDNDDITDFFEFHIGLNPLNELDAKANTDYDLKNNFEEVQAMQPWADQRATSNRPVRYSVTAQDENCIDLSIEDLPIYRPLKQNIIYVHILEKDLQDQQYLRVLIGEVNTLFIDEAQVLVEAPGITEFFVEPLEEEEREE